MNPAALSSALSHLSYDAGREELHVQYRTGDATYIHGGIPQWEYDRLVEAPSKGRHLALYIKPNYPVVGKATPNPKHS